MRFSPPEEPIELYETAFDDEDIFERAKIGKTLSQILERIEDPLVVALDGRWGTGKSYFLQRWVGAHRLQNNGKACTIYFDAFAHDYLSDPLAALVGVVSKRIPESEEKKLNRIKDVAFKFLKPATKVALSLATFGATQAANDLGDAAAEAIGREAESSIDAFWKREAGRVEAVKEFQRAIEALTISDESGGKTPLVIVVDELDRCRPDFALELLEVIKHFFAVPHVHFILGTNLTALENSVKARYGADIDATSYLQKFLSFSLSLSEDLGDRERTPTALQYLRHVGAKMQIPRHLLNETEDQIALLSRANQISVRQVGKILSSLAILPDKAIDPQNLVGWHTTLITLVITRVIQPSIFRKLLNNSIERDELHAFLGVKRKLMFEKDNTGKRNDEHDYKLCNLYASWKFIQNIGVVGDETFDLPDVSQSFGQFRDLRNVRNIPRRIYNDWMNVFKLETT